MCARAGDGSLFQFDALHILFVLHELRQRLSVKLHGFLRFLEEFFLSVGPDDFGDFWRFKFRLFFVGLFTRYDSEGDPLSTLTQ